MKNQTDISLLLAHLGEAELSQDHNDRLIRVVDGNRAEFERIRDDLWQAGEQQATTKVDRLISTFHPACQPQSVTPVL